MKIYITMGQDHMHRLPDGTVVDKDCVARLSCEDYMDGRRLAFDLFGSKWCFAYEEDEWLANCDMSYYPRGVIDV